MWHILLGSVMKKSKTQRTKRTSSQAMKPQPSRPPGRPRDDSKYAKKGGLVSFRPSLVLDAELTKWEELLSKREERQVTRGELMRRVADETFARLAVELKEGKLKANQKELLPFERDEHKFFKG